MTVASFADIGYTITAVPEPPSIVLGSIVGLGFYIRRRCMKSS